MKKSFHLIVLSLCIGVITSLQSQTLVKHNFNNGDLRPYETRKADQRTRVKVTNGAVETRWEQRNYNGTNSGRKAQFMPIGDPKFKQHIWMGMSLKIHSDYMKDNTNTNAGLMQIWGFNGKEGNGNHMCMLKFDGRNGGALVWQHRFNSVKNKTHYLIKDNFPRNKFVDIVIHVQLKNRNEGTVQIWVDGKLTLNKRNQTIGWGDMGANGMINGTYAGGTSLGQYNFMENASLDDAYDGNNISFDGHRRNETRTVTYDNVAVYSGTDGFDLVNPGSSTNPNPPTQNGDIVNMTKRNAKGFAIDGGRGGENRQNIYLQSSNSSNVNQQWNEIDRGNGYYSYQKANTDFCIDGNRGGANGQNVYLWECKNNNQNQHWRKVSMGGGSFRLEKRNAPGFSLDGGNKGANGQNLYLWKSSDTNQNQHWTFGEANKTNDLTLPENGFTAYPNPITDIVNFQLNGSAVKGIKIYNIAGQVIASKIITDSSDTITMDLSNLSSGVYIAKANTGDTFRFVKAVQ